MKAKHTPAPWITKYEAIINGFPIYAGENGYLKIDQNFRSQLKTGTTSWENMEQEMRANASLITAGPEMLEALGLLRNLIDNGTLVRDISNDGDNSHFINQGLLITKVINKMNEAIKKATE